MMLELFSWFEKFDKKGFVTQQIFTRSRSTIKTLEKGAKCVES